MISPLATDDDTSAALAVVKATVEQKAELLSLAGDALCLTVTALRLSDPTPRVPLQKEAGSNPPTISLDQVSWHDHCSDCWVVIYDRVYEITDFLLEHPGGEEILLEYAGRDATLAFRGIGHGVAQLQALERYFLGVLPESERIYSCPGGKLSGFRLS
ncbi:cytochrome b5 type B-like [Zootermopsis nevadensis]|uniref:Cytochrome b5 n=1 Tax=Zootermopsis nevadensis TaxID=136037 RepID=A0A067RJF5_ZOONE|nr:cytochrome b5 type B-like [Zootermopsis nevadensis]KDR24001.1 Cytochrome b5 [Zootermopsis nevadensis]